LKIKILGISGSPRKGNTLKMVSKALEEAEKLPDVECSLITLKGKISPCVDCNKCPVDPPRKYCRISDKMDEIYPKLIDADGIIIGSPVYFGSVTAQVKAFMDRCRPLVRAGMLLRFKVGGAIAVGGGRHAGQEKTLSTIIDYFIITGIFPVGNQNTLQIGSTGLAWKAGEVENDKWFYEYFDSYVTAYDEAKQLGRSVAAVTKLIKAGKEVINIEKEIPSFKIKK